MSPSPGPASRARRVQRERHGLDGDAGTVSHGDLAAPEVGLFATYPGTTVAFDYFRVT